MTRVLEIAQDDADRVLVIRGDEHGYAALAMALRSPETGHLSAAPLDRWSGLRPLGRLQLAVGDDELLVETSGDTAVLTGSAARLDALAAEIEMFLAYNDLEEPGMHMHVDCATGSELGLVLAGTVPDELT